MAVSSFPSVPYRHPGRLGTARRPACLARPGRATNVTFGEAAASPHGHMTVLPRADASPAPAMTIPIRRKIEDLSSVGGKRYGSAISS